MKARLTDGTSAELEATPVGSGGMADVYRTVDGSHVAKLYKDPDESLRDLKRRMRLIMNDYNCVEDGEYWERILCWPAGVVEDPRPGVLMPFVPGRRKATWLTNLSAWKQLAGDEKGWAQRVGVAIRLARGLQRLHGTGLVHGDLSPNNVLVDAETGETTIIDLDGLVVPDFLRHQVLGTPHYMAPELMLGSADPSLATDRHSLAVILHELLLYRHPFEGPKTYAGAPQEAERRRYGSDPVYVAHPRDTSNRPSDLVEPSELGPRFETLFRRAFVDGIEDPRRRPSASQFAQALQWLLDRVVGCPNRSCVQAAFPVTGSKPACTWCGASVNASAGLPLMQFYQSQSRSSGPDYRAEEGAFIVGADRRNVYPWHARYGTVWSPGNSEPVARLRSGSGGWLLENEGLENLAVVEDGSREPVGEGEAVQLEDGMQLLMDEPPHGRLAYVRMLG